MKKIRVLSIFGTRPEAVKMCPLVRELEKQVGIESLVCVTGQHRQMLDQALGVFGIVPDYDLGLMRERQTLTTITADVLSGLEPLLAEARPGLVLVHGDTTTSAAAALAAFYQKIPVGHVEAGLRTYDRYSPFPEEMNRKIISQVAELFFAPTENNRMNLEKENIRENVYVTGNTAIDAFRYTIKQGYQFRDGTLRGMDFGGARVILVTAHRRENLGRPLENICRAVKRIVAEHRDVKVVYPVHWNPEVRGIVFPILGGEERVYLTDPVDVGDMHNAMSRSYIIMTDSGGLQEEGPYLGVPVIVLRGETERPEAVAAGAARVAGVEEDDIYSTASELLADREAYMGMAHAVSPYGDGHASERIVEEIIKWTGRKG